MTVTTLTSHISLDLDSNKPPILRVEEEDAVRWTAVNRDSLRSLVAEHGALLIRGLMLKDDTTITAVFKTVANQLMSDKEALESRHVYADGVYAASKWAANQPMCSHHELSYVCEFPGLMMFACLCAPTSGGETGVADARAVLEALPKELTARFEREGWLLTRTYNDEMGTSVAQSFGSDDRETVEAYCRANGIEFEWLPYGGLKTRQRRSAIIHHPHTGERCWFNQIAFLNEWTLDPEVREYLVEIYEDGLPFNTRFGNGDVISEDVVETINAIYEPHIAREALEEGDLMLVDNVRMAHSRQPFVGNREVLVGMADPVRLADCSPTVEVGCL